MQRLSRSFKVAVLGLLIQTGIGGAAARADAYPAKPVTLIVATGPGSAPDVMARIIADRLAQAWGQQVVILNRPGGGGLIAARAAATAEPDGYTLLFGMSSTFAVLPETNHKLPFDLQRDFVPIGLVSESFSVIAASSQLGISTLTDAIALAKKKPEGLLYAAGNRGSLPNVTGELFARRAGIKLNFVPYPGIAPALNDLIGGRVALMVEVVAGLSGAIEGGSIKPLAVTATKRLPNYPSLPSVSETLPGFEAQAWFALVARSGVSNEIVQRVNHALRGILNQDELQRKFQDLSAYPRPMSPSETISFIRRYQDLWRPLVREVINAQ